MIFQTKGISWFTSKLIIGDFGKHERKMFIEMAKKGGYFPCLDSLKVDLEPHLQSQVITDPPDIED